MDEGVSKDEIFAFAKAQRDKHEAGSKEHRLFGAIYFVLRNRTVDNWGNQEKSKLEQRIKDALSN